MFKSAGDARISYFALKIAFGPKTYNEDIIKKFMVLTGKLPILKLQKIRS